MRRKEVMKSKRFGSGYWLFQAKDLTTERQSIVEWR